MEKYNSREDTSLPPGVDDGALVFADDAVVPLPGLDVDGFADGAEGAQRARVVLVHVLVAVFDQQPNGRRSRVQLSQFQSLNSVPVTP